MKRKQSGSGGSILLRSPGWSLTPLPPARIATNGRRAARAEPAGLAGLPEPMKKGDFEVLDAVEATPAPTRRGVGVTEMPLWATIPADASVLLVVRQLSGAILFRRPNVVGQHRAARRGGMATMELAWFANLLELLPRPPIRGSHHPAEARQRGRLSALETLLSLFRPTEADV